MTTHAPPKTTALIFAFSVLLGTFWAPTPASARSEGVLVTLHCEPYRSPDRDWAQLDSVVTYATNRGIRLNILLGQNWAQTLLDGAHDAKIAQLADWILSGGHQVGMHHHDVTHAFSSGICGVKYSEWDPAWGDWATDCAPIDIDIQASYLAALQDTLRARHGVPPGITTDINTAAQGPSSDIRVFEWQSWLIHYSEGKLDDNPGHCGTVNTSPTCKFYDGVWVPEIGGIQYHVGSKAGRPSTPSATLPEIAASYRSGCRGDFISLNIHPQEYAAADNDGDGTNDDQEIRTLFDAIAFYSVPNYLISEVLALKSCP